MYFDTSSIYDLFSLTFCLAFYLKYVFHSLGHSIAGIYTEILSRIYSGIDARIYLEAGIYSGSLYYAIYSDILSAIQVFGSRRALELTALFEPSVLHCIMCSWAILRLIRCWSEAQ